VTAIDEWIDARVLPAFGPVVAALRDLMRDAAEDPDGLFNGIGKISKHVKIKDLQHINDKALRSYIRQALRLDAEI